MNIVSIDFDIIMAPSISFYNNFTMDRFLFDDPLLKVCNADLRIYKQLTTWLIKNKDVTFIKSHEQILNYISLNDNVVNIDHHHDLGYSKDPEEKCNCGNWAKVLLEEKIIKNYTWIHNNNSIMPDFYKGKIYQCPLEGFNLDNLKADKVIVCLSPEWVPPQYHELFYLWMDIYEKGFEINYERRPE